MIKFIIFRFRVFLLKSPRKIYILLFKNKLVVKKILFKSYLKLFLLLVCFNIFIWYVIELFTIKWLANLVMEDNHASNFSFWYNKNDCLPGINIKSASVQNNFQSGKSYLFSVIRPLNIMNKKYEGKKRSRPLKVACDSLFFDDTC